MMKTGQNMKIKLDDLGIKHNTDKSSLDRSRNENGDQPQSGKPGHDYLRKYEGFISRFKNKPNFRLLELGAGPDWNIGASARLWDEYFQKEDFQLHVVDIKESAKKLEKENLRVTVGDLGDQNLLASLALEKYDVILDDASHFWGHQTLAFENLFPSLKNGGVYIVEDIHTSFGEKRGNWAKGEKVDAYLVFSWLAAMVAGKGRTHPSLPPFPLKNFPILKHWRGIDSITMINEACILTKSRYYR